MFNIKIILLFIVTYLQGFSQLSKKDSLLMQIRNSKDSSVNMKIYTTLFIDRNNASDFKNAILFANRALKLSKNSGDTLVTIISLNNLGDAYSCIGSVNASINFYQEALIYSDAIKNVRWSDNLLGALGVEYTKLGEIQKALKYLKKSLDNNQKIKNKQSYPGIYNNIGILYRNDEKYNLAMDYYFKSIEICIELKNKPVLMQTYNNLGIVYNKIDDQKNAMIYYEKSLLLAIELKNKFQEGIVLGNMGAVYFKRKEYKKAEDIFLKTLKITQDIDDLEGIIESNYNLSEIYEETRRPDKALFYLKAYLKQKEELDKINNENNIHSQEIKSEYEKEKIALKKEQEKRDLISVSEQKRQRYVIYSISIGFLIISILLGFLFKRFKITNSQKLIIENQKKIVEEHQKETIDSINYAKRIQYALLANDDLLNRNLKEHFVFFNPKDIVSGDFYWATEYNNKFYLAVCDCTGHGVPGAFMSLLNIGFLSEAIKEKNIEQPNEVLNFVRKRLIDSIGNDGQQDGMDAILICIDKLNNMITYSAANNEPILISINNLVSELVELPKDKMPVGKGENMNSFSLQTINFKAGDSLYLYTDGFADQFGGPKGKKFKYKQLNEMLVKNSDMSMSNQYAEINNTLTNWKGDLEQVDDILIIGIRL